MAAGLTVLHAQFPAFREAFRLLARETLCDEQLQPRLHLDVELTLGEIDYRLLEQHEVASAFWDGQSPAALLRARSDAGRRAARDERKTPFPDASAGRRRVSRGLVRRGVRDLPRLPWDIAFNIERNEWQGSVSPQIHIRAVRRSE